VRFLKEQSQEKERKPFYAQVGFFETHTPYDYGNLVPDYENGVTVPNRIVSNEAARKHFALLEASVRQLLKYIV
jgi:hypothetical protein